MNTKPTWSNIAGLMVTLLVSLGFGAYLALNQVTDPFLYFDVAFVKSVQEQPAMVIPETGPLSSLIFVPGREMLMIHLTNMMGIDPEVLQFLPVGIVLVSLTLYVLCRRLFNSSALACLTTLYLTLNLSHASALYSVFAYALALPLFLAFIMIGQRLFQRRRPLDIALLLVLFVASHTIHYTVTTWMMLFLLGANAAIWLQQYLQARPVPLQLRPAHYLFLTMFVIFATFNQAIYKSFLPLIGLETLDSAMQRFLAYMSFERPDRSPYYYSRSGLVSLSSTLTLAIILLPVAVGFCADLWQLLVKRSAVLLSSMQLPVIWGILLMGIVDATSYTIRGSISTKSFSMIFPLIAVMYLQRLKLRSAAHTFAALLLATSALKIGVFYDQSYVIGTRQMQADYGTTTPSADWLHSHIDAPRYTMLADLNLYGKYLVHGVPTKQQPIVSGYTLSHFVQVIGLADQPWADPPKIIAVDQRSTEPVIGFVWLLFEPLGTFTDELRTGANLNLIYDDGAILLGTPAAR